MTSRTPTLDDLERRVRGDPADKTAGRVDRAFGAEGFARLRAVKRRCEPYKLLRFNANIPPA